MLPFLPRLIVLLPPPVRAAALLGGLALVAGGCSPRCERMCDKLLECGELGILQTDRYSEFECVDSCERQGELFVGWVDEEEFREAWNEHRDCIASSECEEIAAGVCYDDRFFIVEPVSEDVDE